MSRPKVRLRSPKTPWVWENQILSSDSPSVCGLSPPESFKRLKPTDSTPSTWIEDVVAVDLEGRQDVDGLGRGVEERVRASGPRSTRLQCRPAGPALRPRGPAVLRSAGKGTSVRSRRRSGPERRPRLPASKRNSSASRRTSPLARTTRPDDGSPRRAAISIFRRSAVIVQPQPVEADVLGRGSGRGRSCRRGSRPGCGEGEARRPREAAGPDRTRAARRILNPGTAIGRASGFRPRSTGSGRRRPGPAGTGPGDR